MSRIFNIPKKTTISLIKLYKKYISKFLGNNCRFYPTCSTYAIQAIDKYGIIKGSIKSIKRIIRCNPFCRGGVDKLD